tara:strand:+ start:4602 stop:5408 length:807 start_codon:yes stop_codon:yes gene_type:complete
MIPYIQPIFIPDENHLDINIESIKTFGNYIKEFPYDVKCVFGGWAKSPKWFSEICCMIQKNIPDDIILEIKAYDKNYGKAYVVNDLYRSINTHKFKYFLTADSDIQFSPKICNIFEKLHSIAENFTEETKKKLGLISLNLEDEQCHIIKQLKKEYHVLTSDGTKEKLIYNASGAHIAGGCIFVSRSAWDEVGGYKELSVYGGHDGTLLSDMNQKKYMCVVSPELSVIHPRNKDVLYRRHKQQLQKTKDGKSLKQTMVQTEDFWKNRNL